MGVVLEVQDKPNTAYHKSIVLSYIKCALRRISFHPISLWLPLFGLCGGSQDSLLHSCCSSLSSTSHTLVGKKGTPFIDGGVALTVRTACIRVCGYSWKRELSEDILRLIKNVICFNI